MDGQMIINTGLLPITEGATCFLFAQNIYPSLAESMGGGITIIPTGINSWNQRGMSPALHFDSTISLIAEQNLPQKTLEYVHKNFKYIQVLTAASHMPFEYGEKHSCLSLPQEMPKYMANYMKSLNCSDADFAQLLNAFDNDTCLQNTILVITGDHTVFTDQNRKEYQKYCQENNLAYKVEDAYCPLIIYSPSIEGNIQVTDTCYQMDIYPTIMHLIGCEDYYWKGFGVNLLDSVARHNRPITEQEAYRLSDLMIRSDYFRQYLGK